LYWIVIIGTAIGAFYFIQPYIDSLTNIYGDIREGITGVKAAADTVNGIVR
jgi:hypothetical protein